MDWMEARRIHTAAAGQCQQCKGQIEAGEEAWWARGMGLAHLHCNRGIVRNTCPKCGQTEWWQAQEGDTAMESRREHTGSCPIYLED